MLRVAQEGAPGAGTTAPCPVSSESRVGPTQGARPPVRPRPAPPGRLCREGRHRPSPLLSASPGRLGQGGESGLRGRCGRPRVTKLQPPRARSLPRLPRPTRI